MILNYILVSIFSVVGTLLVIGAIWLVRGVLKNKKESKEHKKQIENLTKFSEDASNMLHSRISDVSEELTHQINIDQDDIHRRIDNETSSLNNLTL